MTDKRLKIKEYPFEIEVLDTSEYQDVYNYFEGKAFVVV